MINKKVAQIKEIIEACEKVSDIDLMQIRAYANGIVAKGESMKIKEGAKSNG